MPPVIKVENLSKMYRLGEVGTGTVRDDLARAWAKLRGKEDPFQKVGHVNRRDEAADGDHDYVWALRDINFEVEQGEILGIIGRNGAGKSTLLKLLSRITAPTRGRIRARGRIASLLEVGTGFHPELTGRENIYLNGTLLGMTRREVTRRLEEIVEFSGCAKYIDTPVKRYSSGMMVRLGFSVAAHLECEILIVDEVLAVGDAEFQKKCLGKMSDVASDGRTILFVSHNMASVQALCQRGIVLSSGGVAFESEVQPAIAFYLKRISDDASPGRAIFERPERAPLWMIDAEIAGSDHGRLLFGENVVIQIRFAANQPVGKPRVGLVLKDANGVAILNANNHYQPSGGFAQPVDSGTVTCDLGSVPLMAQRFTVSLYLGDDIRNYHVEEDALSFEVRERDVWGTGQMPPCVSSLWWNTEFRFQTI